MEPASATHPGLDQPRRALRSVGSAKERANHQSHRPQCEGEIFWFIQDEDGLLGMGLVRVCTVVFSKFMLSLFIHNIGILNKMKGHLLAKSYLL